MTYFEDLVIHFNKVYDIGEKRFVVDANVYSCKIMLLVQINLQTL